MVTYREPLRMTVDEWRELERARQDIEHQYIDGRASAIPGGRLAHGRIGGSALRALEDALARVGSSCSVCNSDGAVHLSSSRYTYPDISVTCDEPD